MLGRFDWTGTSAPIAGVKDSAANHDAPRAGFRVVGQQKVDRTLGG
jgi:hypothetical protein